MLEYNVKGGKMNRGLMATWNFAAPDIGFVFVSHVATLQQPNVAVEKRHILSM